MALTNTSTYSDITVRIYNICKKERFSTLGELKDYYNDVNVVLIELLCVIFTSISLIVVVGKETKLPIIFIIMLPGLSGPQ